MAVIREKMERFRQLSREMRLQQLVSYARKFPELPEELRAARDAGLNRIQECQTPLYLWVGVQGGKVTLRADAPRDAPTVRGFMAFLMEAVNGHTPEEVAELPEDLLDRMGLSEVLGSLRSRGLGVAFRRIREDVARAAEMDREAPMGEECSG